MSDKKRKPVIDESQGIRDLVKKFMKKSPTPISPIPPQTPGASPAKR